MKIQGFNLRFALMTICVVLSVLVMLSGCDADGKSSDIEGVNQVGSNGMSDDSDANINNDNKESEAANSASNETQSSAASLTNDATSTTSSSKVNSNEIKFDADKVVKNTVSMLNTTVSKLTYSKTLSGGHITEILLDRELSENDMSNEIHDSILNLVEYDLFLEYTNKPEQAHPVVIDHTYSLIYKGLSKNEAQHVFEVRIIMNEQKYSDQNFNSDEVVSIATEQILDSTDSMLSGMSKMTDRRYDEVRMIEGVQTYEATEEAAASLARYVKNEIISVLLGAKNYSQFKIEFYAKGSTSYTFILYLK